MALCLRRAKPPLAATATPNAVTASPIASAPIPILQTATRSEHVSSSVVSELSVPLADAVPASAAASEETHAVDAPSGTTSPLIIATSLSPDSPPATSTVLTRAHVRAPEIPPTSPVGLDYLGSISQYEPAPLGDETSDSPSIISHPVLNDIAPFPDRMQALEAETLSLRLNQNIPGVELGATLPVSAALETASRVGQYHDEPVTHAPRVVTGSAVSSPVSDAPSVAAGKPAAPDAATEFSSASAVGAATASRSVIESSPDAAATTRPSPYPAVAPSQARTASVHVPSDSAEHIDIPGVDIGAESSTD